MTFSESLARLGVSKKLAACSGRGYTLKDIISMIVVKRVSTGVLLTGFGGAERPEVAHG